MATSLTKRAQRVDCPVCGVPAGMKCRSIGVHKKAGKKMRHQHQGRYDACREKRRKAELSTSHDTAPLCGSWFTYGVGSCVLPEGHAGPHWSAANALAGRDRLHPDDTPPEMTADQAVEWCAEWLDGLRFTDVCEGNAMCAAWAEHKKGGTR